MTETTYTFDGPADAARYLREVGLLWAVWSAGLVGVLVASSFFVVGWAIVMFIALFYFARPLQARSVRVVPNNSVEGGRLNAAFRGGTKRDRALRELLYGTAPLRVALSDLGLSARWIVIRHLVVALTVLAMIYVVLGPRP